MDERVPESQDIPALARERVGIGPAPDWVVSCSYEDFTPNIRGALTYLMIEQQVHAELRQTYNRVAVRLETLQAVQHQSQWRFGFEPQTQSVVLHSVKIRRGTAEREHASREKLQFLQREAGLEGFVIDGWITLLLLLEDVVPGDILEYAYTLTSRPRLLPQHVDAFMALPVGTEIGKYHFSVLHAPARALKWKAATPVLEPKIETTETLVRCFWAGEKMTSPEPEPCTPAWHLDFPWLQVSDFPDWQTVSRGVIDAWKEEAAEGFNSLVAEIKASGSTLQGQVDRAIERVQDGFRYLSVNLELGGQVPAPAETVIRRRYGDCKDLAFLLVMLLRALGVPARPVLVNAHWRKAVGSMLPSPNVFNHVVVEFELENQKRWVDATLKRQGGGALGRPVMDFGLGLPVDAGCSGLAEVPTASLLHGEYNIRESFILDTAGSPSYYALVCTATGVHAEGFRFDFENEGIEAIAKKRLQSCADRFGRAQRLGSLQFRDDRERNEFIVAEVFEIEGFLKQDTDPNFCLFLIRSDLTASALFCPSPAPRRATLELPFPCNRVHTVEIDFNGLNARTLPVVQTGNEFLRFSRRCKSLQKFLKVTFTLNTCAGYVPPDKIPEHRRMVEQVWREAALELRMPVGYARTRKRSDFGALPPPSVRQPVRAAVTPGASRLEPGAVPQLPLPRESACVEPVATKPVATAEQREFAGLQVAPAPLRVESCGTDKRAGRRTGGSKRGSKSLFIGLAALVAVSLGIVLAAAGAVEVAGLVVVLSIPALIWSLVLAVVSLREAKRRHGSIGGHGQATAALVLGALLAIFLMASMIGAASSAMKNAAARKQHKARAGSGATMLKFPEFSFDFLTPAAPWVQVDARTFGTGPKLAFVHPDGLCFRLGAESVPTWVRDPLVREVERCRASVRLESASFQFADQKQVKRSSLEGVEIDGQGTFQGHEYYVIHWITSANGCTYTLAVWGPPSLRTDIRSEADKLFSDFIPKVQEQAATH